MTKRVHVSQAVDPYQTAHDHVRSAKGHPSEYGCVDCGSVAREWSLRRQEDCDGNLAVVGVNGNARWISDTVADYQPRCATCHRAHDRAEREEFEARDDEPEPYADLT